MKRKPKGMTVDEYFKCYRKFRYPDYLIALNKAAELVRNKNERFIETYLCSYCAGFHVGHNEHIPKVRKRIHDLKSRLGNQDFLQKAPAMIIEEYRARLASLEKDFPNESQRFW